MVSAIIKVFIVEDQGVVLEALKAFIRLEGAFQLVGEASNGLEVVAKVLNCNPDVVIMDLALPGIDGVKCTAQLLESNPTVRVIALTAQEDVELMREALKAGAKGYVLKRSLGQELSLALSVVARGGIFLDPIASDKLHSMLAQSSDIVSGGSKLSEREIQVITLVAKGLSSKAIAIRLAIKVKTVETYKARASEKLGVKSRAGLVKHALEGGWFNDSDGT